MEDRVRGEQVISKTRKCWRSIDAMREPLEPLESLA